MKIKLTQLASRDLQSVYDDFISKENPTAAHSVIHRVIESIDNIAAFPGIGRPGRVPHTKELVLSSTPLIIIYQVRNDTLYIARIIHAARKWP